MVKYPPPPKKKKSVQVNFLWGRNDVRTAIKHAYWRLIPPPKILYPQNKFLATPLVKGKVRAMCLRPVESNAGVGDHNRAAEKAPEGDDTTHIQHTNFFSRISHIQTHVLKPLLSANTQHSYNLRDRSHNYSLINKDAHINDRHFIVRLLYKHLINFYRILLLTIYLLSCVLSTLY